MSGNGNDILGEVVESQAIVPAQVHLGSLAVAGPAQLVSQATDMANALAQVIENQHLYSVINKKKYVMVEGWTTLGAMIGVIPIEDSCTPITDDKGASGFMAKVKLLRSADGGQVGGASAECTRSEANWSQRDSYALRSMATTRATGKAFRLSFSWIMKLAGYEATPAEEMQGVAQAERQEGVAAAQAVAQQKIADYQKRSVTEVKDKKVEIYPVMMGDVACVAFVPGPALALMLERGAKDFTIYSDNPNHKARYMPDDPSYMIQLEGVAKPLGITIKRLAQGPAASVVNGKPAPKPPAEIDQYIPNWNVAEPVVAGPVIVSTKRVPAAKPTRLIVVWGGRECSCWHQSIWEFIEKSVGKPASFTIIEKEKDGKTYYHIEKIERIGNRSYEEGLPVRTMNDSGSSVSPY